MSSVNKAIILGRLGKDPEIKNTGNSDVCNLSIATSETWKDKRSGERKEKTEWHRITVWNEIAIQFLEKHCKKGDQVYIEGKIETRKYEKDGVDTYTTEIVVPMFGGDVRKIWEREGNDGGDSDRGGGRSSDRGSDRGNDRGSSGNGRSGGGDRTSSGSRGNDRGSNDRGSDRGGGSNDRGSRGGNDRDNGRGSTDGGRNGNGGGRNGGGRDNNDMDDDIPF